MRSPSLAGDPLPTIRTPALRAAALRVADTWLAKAGDGGRILEQLALLCAAVEGGDASLAPAQHPGGALRRRLLHPLRLEVERGWLAADPAPAADEMLRALRVFDELAARDTTPVPATTPDELELIVEVAHDLRSPLTSILFLSETLRKGQSGALNDLQRRQMGLIYSAAMGMVSLASDVIELAHGGERLVEAHGSPFAVSEVLSSVCDLVQPLAEEKKISLRILPPPSDHRIGFSAALSRVLLNLVTNAIKFTDEGFVEITTHARGPSRVEFSVRDTGPGIKPEARTALFDPFRPGRTGDRYGFSGTGLGLAICRRLVAAMHSELHYETSPGWGTRFYFEVELPPASL